MGDLLSFMTDDDLKKLLLAALEFDDSSAGEQVEQMLNTIPADPMTFTDAEEIANSVILIDEQFQEQDFKLKKLLRSAAADRYMSSSDEEIAAMLDAVDEDPITRVDAESLAATVIQADDGVTPCVHRNGHLLPTKDFDWLRWLNSLDLVIKSPIRLPDHTVVDELWELGRILERPDCGAIIEKLGNAILARARKCPEFIAPSHGRKIIVAHSELMHHVAIKVASQLKNCHVCKVMGYNNPRVIASPTAIRDARVLLLFDIVDTGTLLRRIREGISTQRPRAIYALAILNQGEAKDGLHALCNTIREERRPAGTTYAYVYDDLEGRSKVGVVPDALKDEKNAKEALGKCLDEMRRKGWLDWFEQCDAIRSDRELEGRKYTLFFDIPTVVRNFPQQVLEASLKALDEFPKRAARRVIVFPATRHKRVGKLVELLASHLGWEAAQLGSKKASKYVFDSNGRVTRLLQECEGHALVVDCAIRTGETLQGLAVELKNLGATDIAAFYVMDALYDWVREKFEGNDGIPITSCFRLPLAMPSTSKIGPLWRAGFEQMLAILQDFPHLSSEAKSVIRDFCCAKLKAKGRTRPGAGPEVETKIVEDATLRLQPHTELDKWLTRRDQGRGGIIKKLDINQVLKDPLIQYKLAGVVSNSAPAVLKEWCVLALCTAKRFDLLAENCLLAPESPFKAETPEKWGIVPFIAFNAARNDPIAAETMRLEVRKIIDTATSSMLFPEVDGQIAEKVNRCRIVEEILTPVGVE